jgi:hypothetical protein
MIQVKHKIKLMTLSALLYSFGVMAEQPQGMAIYEEMPSDVGADSGQAGENSKQNPSLQEENKNYDRELSEAIESVVPMTPEQATRVRKKVDDYKRAMGAPIRNMDFITRSVQVSLSPGEELPTINLAKGMPTTIAFLDSMSRPWQILGKRNSNNLTVEGEPISVSQKAMVQSGKNEGADTNVEINKNQFGYFLTITPKDYSQGIVTVYLEGAKVPVSIRTAPADKAADVRVELMLEAVNPKNIMDPNLMEASHRLETETKSRYGFDVEQYLMDTLMGIKPSNDVKKIVVSGDTSAKAWMKEDVLFLRTKFKILSPSTIYPTATTQSIDGTYAYALPYEFPILALGESGETVFIREVEGF